MKKVFLILLTAIFTIVSYILVVNYAEVSFCFLKYNPQTEIEVSLVDQSAISSIDVYDQIVQDAAISNGVNVYKIAYPNTPEGETQKIVLYSYIVNPDVFYQNIPLESGRYLTKEDGNECFLSTEDTGDPNQVGQMDLFKGDTILEIRPFSADPSPGLDQSLMLDTNDTTVAGEFFSGTALQATVSIIVKNSMYTDTLTATHELTVIYMAIFGVLCLCAIFTYLYLIISGYKRFAIQKLMGYDNRRVKRGMQKKLLLTMLPALALSFLFTVGYLIYYNGLAQFFSFLPVWLLTMLIGFLLAWILFSLCHLLVKGVHVAQMMKQRKPVRLIAVLTMVGKAAVCFVMIAVGVLLVGHAAELSQQTSELEVWQNFQNYAYPQINFPLSQEDPVGHELACMKCKDYFARTSDKGGILFRPGGGLKSTMTREHYLQQGKQPWQDDVNTIEVNNTYLQKNVIYDVDGNPVNLTNSNDDRVILLVPEQYQSFDAQIREEFTRYDEIRYSSEDILLEAQGITPPEHPTRGIEIIYVQDGQKYFTMNPDYGEGDSYYYTDPIVKVVNNVNMDPSMYLAYISQGHYYVPVADPNQPYESLKADIEASGLQGNVVTTPTIYSKFSDDLYLLQQESKLYFSLFVFAFVVYLIVISVCIKNAIEMNKQRLAVENLHGYSLLRRFRKLFLEFGILWGLLWCIGLLFFPAGILTLITLACILVDCMASLISIKYSELAKVKDILKGEFTS